MNWLSQLQLSALIVYLLIGFFIYCVDVFYARASRFSLFCRYQFIFLDCVGICLTWPYYLAWCFFKKR